MTGTLQWSSMRIARLRGDVWWSEGVVMRFENRLIEHNIFLNPSDIGLLIVEPLHQQKRYESSTPKSLLSFEDREKLKATVSYHIIEF